MERRGNGMADGLWAAAKEGLAVFGAGRREVLWLGLTQICFEGKRRVQMDSDDPISSHDELPY